MGMSYTGFGAPVTTKNLQANADLNLGNYDLITTDAKGDTAEFSEFVGGVGNFDSTLTRGNAQIDGNILLEGSINNVNIDDTGEITTAQGINADTGVFNGVVTAPFFNGKPLSHTLYVTNNEYLYNVPIWVTPYTSLTLFLCYTSIDTAYGPMVYIQPQTKFNVHFTALFPQLGRSISENLQPVSISKIISNVDDLTLSLTVPSSCKITYNTVVYNSGEIIPFTVEDINKICIEGIDFTIEYSGTSISLPSLAIVGTSATTLYVYLGAY